MNSKQVGLQKGYATPRGRKTRRARSRSASIVRKVTRKVTRRIKKNYSRSQSRNKKPKRARRRRQRAAPAPPEVPNGLVGMMDDAGLGPEVLKGLPSQFAFTLGAMRPGEFVCPYVESAGNMAPLPSGIATGNFVKTIPAADWGSGINLKQYMTICMSTTPAAINGASGLSQPLYHLNGTSSISTSNVITMEAFTDVWGAKTFTDKLFITGITSRLIVRTTAANLAGSVFIAQASISQIVGGVTVSSLLQHAIEVDLRKSNVVEGRAFICDLDLPHRKITNTDDMPDETVTVFIFPYAPALALGTTTPVDVTFDWSFKMSYLWWPDYASPALAKIGPGFVYPVERPTDAEQAAVDTLDRLITSPVPPTREAFIELIKWAMRIKTVKSTRLPIESKTLAITNGDSNSFNPFMINTQGLAGWRDFAVYASSVSRAGTEVVNGVWDWIKMSGLAMVKDIGMGAVKALLQGEEVMMPNNFSDDRFNLDWVSKKLDSILCHADYPVEVLELYDNLQDTIDDLREALRLESLWAERCRKFMLEVANVCDRKHGLRYFKIEDPYDFIDLKQEFAKLRYPTKAESVVAISETDKAPDRSSSRKSKIVKIQ